MATFTTFSNYLPDPIWKITEAGNQDSSTGAAGPGFASMKLRSVEDTQVSRTISGRGVHRDTGSHHWEIDINYNPMMRSQFDPVDTFLQARSRMSPFYIVLPQNAAPKDSSFNTFITTNAMSVQGTHLAGSSFVMIDASIAVVGNPSIGDLVNFVDGSNTNHQKTYKITRVETAALYQAGTTVPTTLQKRIWINPPLERNLADNSFVRFINPQIRVIPKSDVLEYDLNTDNLYSFSLSLEEIMP